MRTRVFFFVWGGGTVLAKRINALVNIAVSIDLVQAPAQFKALDALKVTMRSSSRDSSMMFPLSLRRLAPKKLLVAPARVASELRFRLLVAKYSR